MNKDKTKIPEGIYCYRGNELCPYYKTKIISPVKRTPRKAIRIPYCSYLEEGDITNLKDWEIEELKQIHKCDINTLWELYPLDLLWDSVKECNIKEDYDEP